MYIIYDIVFVVNIVFGLEFFGEMRYTILCVKFFAKE